MRNNHYLLSKIQEMHCEHLQNSKEDWTNQNMRIKKKKKKNIKKVLKLLVNKEHVIMKTLQYQHTRFS